MSHYPGPVVQAFPAFLTQAIIGADFACASHSTRAAHAEGCALLHGCPLAALANCCLPSVETACCRGTNCLLDRPHLVDLPLPLCALPAGPTSEVPGICAFTNEMNALFNCFRLSATCVAVTVFANGELAGGSCLRCTSGATVAPCPGCRCCLMPGRPGA